MDTQAAFDADVLGADGPVVVAFEDRDCDHCRSYRQLLDLAWRQQGLHVATARVDAADMPDLMERFSVVGYPTLLVFVSGRVVRRAAGVRAPLAFASHLATHFAVSDLSA